MRIAFHTDKVGILKKGNHGGQPVVPFLKKRHKIFLGTAALVLLLNLLAWGSRDFSDIYIAYVFPLWVNTYGRFTGMFPFSVGECLIVVGILLAAAAVCTGLIFAIHHKPSRFRDFARGFFAFLSWFLLVLWLVMTLNCVILYHASTFSARYFGEDAGGYTLEELIALRNNVAERCNALSGAVERSADGSIHYPGSVDAAGNAVDMNDKSREVMRQLGAFYAQLDGYYPRPKPLRSSDFMCQQYMQGYYFPFSMEANYNDVMTVMNKPSTMCHELAHLRGYIYEDEASFISYLACIQSDDIYFQYSGYLSVLNYLENDLYQAKRVSPEAYVRAGGEDALVEILPAVWEDNIFVEESEWARIHEKSLFDTETVEEVTDTFLDTTLKIHGVADGTISYGRVVTLLLQYYRQSFGQVESG